MNQQLAYLAGLFDGEGWVRIAKYKQPNSTHVRYQLMCGIAMTDPRPLRFAKSFFGGSIHVQKRSKPNHKPLHQWVLASNKASEFLVEISQWLIVKAAQGALAVKFQNHIDKHRYGSRTVIDGKKRNLPASVIAYREKCSKEIFEMKHRVVS